MTPDLSQFPASLIMHINYRYLTVQSQDADLLTSDYGDTIANSTMPEGLALEVVQ